MTAQTLQTVGILTDSTASIPRYLIGQLGIEIVPYYIHRGLETLRDTVDIEPAEFAAWLADLAKAPALYALPPSEVVDRLKQRIIRQDTGDANSPSELPKTANPGPGDYLVGMRNLARHFGSILALTMTSKGSGAYQACRSAIGIFREESPDMRVEVLDTQQVAMSHGWAAIEAARAAISGLSFDAVLARAREVSRAGVMLQTNDTLRYLYMGGRIGRAQHLVGTLLRIKPIISMGDGEIVALGIARGRSRAYERMVELMQRHVGEGTRIKVAFTHVAAEDHLSKLRAQVAGHFEQVETIVAELSPALAVHSGPGTVGISFFPAQEDNPISP